MTNKEPGYFSQVQDIAHPQWFFLPACFVTFTSWFSSLHPSSFDSVSAFLYYVFLLFPSFPPAQVIFIVFEPSIVQDLALNKS
jgi:hypothetical protein